MAEIGRRVGVSKATVSLALRGDSQIPPATREKIMKVARTMGYVSNPVVAQLMVELRRNRVPVRHRTLALLNANKTPDAFRRHLTVPIWVEGCRRRAEQLGYGTDEFWIHDPACSAERLRQILESRGIEGAIILGAFSNNRLPPSHAAIWENFACVATGVRTHEPTLSYCSVDHHELMIELMQHVRALGYRRPALVIDRITDRLVDGRFTSAMWLAQSELPAADRTVPFLDGERARQKQPGVFLDWLRVQRPDVLLTFYTEVKDWLAMAKLRVPEDMGVALLERRPIDKQWAGMNQCNDLTGEAAVDLVVSMLHRREIGLPRNPVATFTSAQWIPGSSVRSCAVSAKR